MDSGLPDLAGIVIPHCPKYHHLIPHPQKYRARHQSEVHMLIRSKVMVKKKYILGVKRSQKGKKFEENFFFKKILKSVKIF